MKDINTVIENWDSWNARRERFSDKSHWMQGLGYRAKNTFIGLGIETREQAVEEFRCGRLYLGRHRPRNYGKKTHMEVAEFLGLDRKLR